MSFALLLFGRFLTDDVRAEESSLAEQRAGADTAAGREVLGVALVKARAAGVCYGESGQLMK